LGDNILPGSDAALKRHSGPLYRGVLDHDDGVGAGRERSAGHDGGALASANGWQLVSDAGTDLAQQFQLCRAIGGADGVAVAGGAREGRKVAVGEDFFGEDSIVCC